MLGEAARFVAPGAPDELASVLRELAASGDTLDARQRAYRLADKHFRPAVVVDALAERIAAEGAGR
jgi:hypothetical protein